jgi:hypothetical protein
LLHTGRSQDGSYPGLLAAFAGVAPGRSSQILPLVGTATPFFTSAHITFAASLLPSHLKRNATLRLPTPRDAVAALEEFSRYARYYRQLGELEPDEVEGPFLNQAQSLNVWEVDVAYPFLMQALEWVESDQIDIDQLLIVMKMIESFVVRRTVCSVPTNRLRRVFARMSIQVDISDFASSSRNYLLANEWPSDEEFRYKFINFRLYLRARLGRTRLVLESLERSFNHKEAPELNDKVTIEHIMPQSLSPGWSKMLGPSASEVHAQWLDTVGNLTLSGYNPELGNRGFEEKRQLLAQSNFALGKSLPNYREWNGETIQNRAAALAEQAVGIWTR